MKKMTKFEIKAFECEILGGIYDSLESRKEWYMKWDNETSSYIQSDDMHDIEKIAIIDDIMKRIEKML